MESYFNLLPEELLYIIIDSIKDKYEIDNLINSSERLSYHFCKDMNWKKMFYINYKGAKTVINKLHTWRDNYMDNLNVKDKYNLNMVDANDVEYVIFFEYRITETVGRMRNKINALDRLIRDHDWYQDSGDRVAYMVNTLGEVVTNPEDIHQSKAILDFIHVKLKMRDTSIGFRSYNISAFEYINLFMDNEYRSIGNNLIKIEIEGIKVLLVSASNNF